MTQIPHARTCAVFFLFLFVSHPFAVASMVSEDFEAYETRKPLDGQGEWIGSPFGTKPAGMVVAGNEDANRTKYLQGPGGADHYNVLKFPSELQADFRDSPILWLSVVRNKNCSISLGKFSVNFGDRISCSQGDAIQLAGLADKVEGNSWIESVFVLEKKEDGQYTVRAGSRPWPSTEGRSFATDPMLAAAPAIAPELLALETWKSLRLRLDGTNAIDDLRVGTCERLDELPFKFEAPKKVEPAYSPILDHVMPPREVKDLDGIWEAAPAPAAEPKAPASGWQMVLVPDAHPGLFSKANNAVWFRKTFKFGPQLPQMRYFLCFERVADTCRIFLNDQEVGGSEDGYTPFRIDVTNQIVGGDNHLQVKVLAPPGPDKDGKFSRPAGLGLRTFLGIPGPVHVESAGELTIEDVFVITKLTPVPSLEARVTIRNNSQKPMRGSVRAAVAQNFSQDSAPENFSPGERKTLVLKGAFAKPHLWWPHDPHLQFCDVSVTSDGKVEDAMRQRFGFREISVKGPDMFLNAVKFMHRRSTTFSYWSSQDEAAQKKEIALLKKRGFNGSRVSWGPSFRMARICDELGWLLDEESAICAPKAQQVTDAFWPAAQNHIASMVKALRNSPSVIYWGIENEFSMWSTGTPEEMAAWADKVAGWGTLASQLDPTRIWTADGEGEVGGKGKHGPAPSLNLHYPWQPFKIENMIPNTADWLDKGLPSWYGIVWDRTKPLMIGEDLYPPYSLKIPHGMTQWAGDSAYDPEKGVYKAWFDAIRMLTAGYYHAGVSCLNIWATAEATAVNPLYDFGQPVPDFLIAFRESSGNLYSHSTVSRTIILYNQTFGDVEGILTSLLTGQDKEYGKVESTVSLPAGESKEVPIPLEIPDFQSKSDLHWSLTLTDKTGQILAQQKYDLTAFPKSPIVPPANCALVASDDQILKGVVFPAGRFADLQSALQKRPSTILLASYQLTAEDATALKVAVSKGLKALLLESPATGMSPVQIDSNHRAAFAFIRAPLDPAIKGFDDKNLRLWEPSHLASSNTFLKPQEGDYDIILDCGGPAGLQYTPLMRACFGKGYYLLCQMPILSSLEQEPAASHLLQSLFSSLNAPIPIASQFVALAGDPGGALAEALKKAKIPVSTDAGTAPLLLVNGREPLSKETLSMLKERFQNGGSAMLSGLTKENASLLSQMAGFEISLTSSPAHQLLRKKPLPLIAGLSNQDLCWFQGDDFAEMISAQMSGRQHQPKSEPMLDGEMLTNGPGVESPLFPCGLLRIPLFKGNLILSTIRWEQFLTSHPVQAQRVISTLLHNLGCKISRSSGVVRNYRPIDLKKLANRGFGNQEKIPGWFGDAKDDLRYFPVNVTGNDPILNLPQPIEKFPESPLNYAGIDFEVINPETNSGRSCLVINAGGTVSIPVNAMGSSLWMLGALDKMKPDSTEVARISFVYSDRTSERVPVRAGVELNGYQGFVPVSQGVCAWTGPTPSRPDAVLWRWSVANPHPDKTISSITVEPVGEASIGLVGITVEEVRN